jgi:hypothetical protein
MGYFGAQQIAGLGAATIAAMTTARFDQIVAPYISALSIAAIKVLTVAEIASLTASQAAGFSAAQMAAMSAGQLAAIGNPIAKEALSLEVNGALGFAGALQVLQDAAVGGMTATKFSQLQQLAGQINVGSGPQMTASLQQLFDDVVLGNAANAHWNGGAATAVALGNLSATSSQTQVGELIGKWFLGTDNPNAVVGNLVGTYHAATAPLFSAAGPQLTDVNQGDTGDCYFVAALAETALVNPSLIKNMITQNSNGTYSVEFWLNGKADFVTVDNQLAAMPTGYSYGDGSNLLFDHGGSGGKANDWSAIIEKAYVEFRAQTDGVNSYTHISGGWDNGLNAVTNQSVADIYTSPQSSTSGLASLLTTLKNAMASGEDVLMSTNGADIPNNLVDSHMYAITGVNLAAGTVSLDNPWNGSGIGTNVAMQFTSSIASLAKDSVTFHVAAGAPAIA